MILGHGDYNHWFQTYAPQWRDVVMPISAKELLMAGVTTARDLGAPLDDIVAVKKRIERGEIPGPRLFVSGPSCSTPRRRSRRSSAGRQRAAQRSDDAWR